MAQNNTTVPNKSPGDIFSSAELNNITSTINSNATDSETRISGLETAAATHIISGDNISLFNNDSLYVISGDNVSDLANDALYVVSGDNVSDLANDLLYVASGDNVSDLANDSLYVASGDNVSDLANDSLYVASGDNVSLLVNDENYLTGVSAGTNVTIDDTNPLNPIINSTTDDTAYGISWDSNTDAATKNAIYDKIESVSKTWLITKIGNEDDDASGTGEKVAWVAPASGKIYAVHSASATVTAGGTITTDVKKEGVSILGTLGVISSGGDSTISGTPHTLTANPTSFAAGDRISFEINAISATSGAKGLHTDLQVSWD